MAETTLGTGVDPSNTRTYLDAEEDCTHVVTLGLSASGDMGVIYTVTSLHGDIEECREVWDSDYGKPGYYKVDERLENPEIKLIMSYNLKYMKRNKDRFKGFQMKKFAVVPPNFSENPRLTYLENYEARELPNGFLELYAPVPCTQHYFAERENGQIFLCPKCNFYICSSCGDLRIVYHKKCHSTCCDRQSILDRVVRETSEALEVVGVPPMTPPEYVYVETRGYRPHAYRESPFYITKSCIEHTSSRFISGVFPLEREQYDINWVLEYYIVSEFYRDWTNIPLGTPQYSLRYQITLRQAIEQHLNDFTYLDYEELPNYPIANNLDEGRRATIRDLIHTLETSETSEANYLLFNRVLIRMFRRFV